jgi:nitrogen-specific signal transduction histidine kinase
MPALVCSSRWLAVTLSPEAIITSFSNGADEFTGYSVHELVGRPIAQILSDRSAFEMQHALDSAQKCGYWEGKIAYRGRNGSHEEARRTVILPANRISQNSEYLLISGFDEPVNAGNDSNVNGAEVGTHLRTLAHELNNPLAAMMGFAQLAILNTNCPEDIRSDIETIYSELQRVAQIVERLHDYGISLHKKTPQITRISQVS